ncbi:hypothetical protein GCWU000324_02972 [Kingella oralis ATCC 51147]|uniref:Uncharacterized protein n=1 Tax=Kingella oralis ATCC 51147 TaxID=629741 RepID=C4GMN7_9NEIS|nr:hypothetical protein GCWU000324_02972 [Kingella oralis ATCC 51147]
MFCLTFLFTGLGGMGSLKSLRNRRSGIDARHFSLWRMKINSLAFVEHQCPTYNSSLFFQSFLNIKQDSRLRGNDGVSYFQAAFAMPKGSLKRLRYGNGKSGYGGDTPCSVSGCTKG